MEKKLSQMFDFQHFSGSSRLATVIADVESRYAGALCDDELEMVSAAGESEKLLVPEASDLPMAIRMDDSVWEGYITNDDDNESE